MNGTGVNANAPWLNVFYFNDNERLKIAVQAYYAENCEHRATKKQK